MGASRLPYQNETQKRKKVWELADGSVRKLVKAEYRARHMQIRVLKKAELLRLGRRIRRARELLGFSDAFLAAACGLDKDYFRQIESGGHDVLFSELCEISEVLRCDIAAVTKGIPRVVQS
jgi:ribosome-binding protein aMBF1 (putative translation factor)